MQKSVAWRNFAEMQQKKRKLNAITEGYLKLLVWRKGEDGGIKWGFWLGNLAYLLA